MINHLSPERAGRITASAVGAILGHSPFMTRNDAMRSMVRSALGAESEFSGNIATAYGSANEAGAIIEFQMEMGLTVTKAPFIKMEDWAGCTPDGFVSDGGGLEQKCPFSLRKAPAPVPFKSLRDQPQYYDQVQFSMFVTGLPHWHFAQWAPQGTAHEIAYPDQGWLDHNLPRLRQFHAEFLDELANNPDEYLAPKRVEIDTPQAAKMVAEWDALNEQLDLAAERKKDLLADMVALAGDKDALIAGRKLTLAKRAGAISYAKALKALAPDADLEPWRGEAAEYWGLR